MKQATVILAKHVVAMHKRDICWLTFDCWMPKLIRGMIRELPTDIPDFADTCPIMLSHSSCSSFTCISREKKHTVKCLSSTSHSHQHIVSGKKMPKYSIDKPC